MKYSKEWLSKEEILTLFNYPKISSRNLLLMKICYYGAFRISEVLNSKREDYREEDDYYFLILRDQKTDKLNWEKQPIPFFIFGEINRYCNDLKIKTQDYIFSSNRNEKLSYKMAYIIVKKWTKEASINKPITTHSFRRSRATHLLDGGMPLYNVSKFLRHKSIETTMKYLKISKKNLYSMMEEIDNKNLL